MKSISKIIKEELLKEVGGYDDPVIMAKHSGKTLTSLIEVLASMLESIKGLAQLILSDKFDRVTGKDLLTNLSDIINEGIRVTNILIKDFTEDDVIFESKKFIKKMNEFKRKIRLLSNLGPDYTQQQYNDEILNLISNLEPTIMGYGSMLNKVNNRFMDRFQSWGN